VSDDRPDITIPTELLPVDGRFGSGPSKVRPEAVEALMASAPTYLGTSHRQPSVRFMVAALRNGVAELLNLPDGYEVLLGNGGTTAFWDSLICSFIDERSEHLVFGEFSSKFAAAVRAAPHLEDPVVVESEPGTHPDVEVRDDVDVYALTHNETSTGVAMEMERPPGEALVAVDATSAAGGMRFDPAAVDVYYFAPQKCLASDGGLWIAACSPAAIQRIEAIAASGRWLPPSLDLRIALENSRKDQTYNTPGLATVFLAAHQVEWLCQQGGLEWAARRCDESARILYGWAEAGDATEPFVKDPAMRSPVVGTIDFEGVDAPTIAGVLRANGILDTEPYRKLGRNQLRIALYPAIDPADVEALTRCIDHVVERLS